LKFSCHARRKRRQKVIKHSDNVQRMSANASISSCANIAFFSKKFNHWQPQFYVCIAKTHNDLLHLPYFMYSFQLNVCWWNLLSMFVARPNKWNYYNFLFLKIKLMMQFCVCCAPCVHNNIHYSSYFNIHITHSRPIAGSSKAFVVVFFFSLRLLHAHNAERISSWAAAIARNERYERE
jgi:hypothetical protein